MNKPTVLSTGEWLMPAAVWDREPNTDAAYRHDLGVRRGANVMASTDRGAAWDYLGQVIVPGRVFDEHSIVERRDGSLWALVRAAYGIGESVSTRSRQDLERGPALADPARELALLHPPPRFRQAAARRPRSARSEDPLASHRPPLRR